LTTRGRKSRLPREIEIWFVYRDGRFYMIAEYSTSHWVQNLRADPEVQVQVAGERFRGRSRIVPVETEPELVAAIQSLSREKYGWGKGLVVEVSPEW
jgi:deazaflavin-dependent oxidoreductase (nitroreductase family)